MLCMDVYLVSAVCGCIPGVALYNVPKLGYGSCSGNRGLLVELRMPSFQMNDEQTPWNFTSSVLYCLSNQSISIL